MLTEDGNSIEERLKRLEKGMDEFRLEHKRVVRNSLFIALLRYALVASMGGVGLIAALLSGATYEQKIGEGSMISFHGAEFKGALQILAGIAGTATGVVGFGDRLIKKGEKD
jgi:hypothetical protein